MRLRTVLLPALAAGLLLSIPLKAWTIVAAHDGDGPASEDAIARLLDGAGFETRDDEHVLGRRAVVGEAGSCHVWMGIVSGEGWHRDVVVSSASPTTGVAFFFKGRAYADQPTWATWFDEKSSVLARSFALPVRPAPVVAALIGEGCRLDRSAWAERLATL